MIKRLRNISIGDAFKIFRRGLNTGYCPICEKKTLFFIKADGLRDNYHCIRCRSIPRQRALLQVMQQFFPDWRNLNIHESSPSGATFKKFSSECQGYLPSQFFSDIPPGVLYSGHRCEDLARQTFDDESFDLVITQDVLEHLLNPIQSLKEICRTLRPGGTHIFTVPWYSWQDTKIRAIQEDDKVVYLEEPDYHVNPINNEGSLVVTEWGKDLIDTIYASSGMTTTVIHIHDKQAGIEAKFIEVFVSRKLSGSMNSLTDRWVRQ
ncbi:MAG TPA: class I SAM-dependent methyltransferase [Gammaproteobacteria bacterium]|nr:class I SAM-dependent methyltransferase [Gammaproteobacteria bacterium]